MPTLQDTITTKLIQNLNPEHLVVHNDSSKHAGHSGAGQESHFRVEIKSTQLQGLTRVAAHQRIYQILETEIQNGIHALQIIII